jgi:uncharacterized membrane protein YqjE
MDAPREDAPRGIFASLRTLVDRALAMLHCRADLLSTELEEEVTRLVGVLIWSIVGIQCAIVGFTLLAITVLLLIPPDWRPLASGIFAAAFIGIAVMGAMSIRKIARAKPRPFDATLHELEKDRDRLRGDD